mmetsp:Transcript_19017/g.44701  ORF Transcript_19017/g.44701 Transcript_19017/m.44701 type:complete len:121 (-) Transcript_19017:95-457(-)
MQFWLGEVLKSTVCDDNVKSLCGTNSSGSVGLTVLRISAGLRDQLEKLMGHKASPSGGEAVSEVFESLLTDHVGLSATNAIDRVGRIASREMACNRPEWSWFSGLLRDCTGLPRVVEDTW